MTNIKDSVNQTIQTELTAFIKLVRIDLQHEDKFRRKKGLQDLNNKLFDGNNYSQVDYHKVFFDIHLHLIKCFRDHSELCRELIIKLMTNFIQNLDLNDYYLTYMFPVMVERIGTAELVEDSEEIRLALVEFLLVILKRYSKSEFLVPFLNDIVQILVQTSVDKYPKVREISFKCVIEAGSALPRHFHMQCESLVTPILKSFNHQHFRVRILAVNAIGEIILHCKGDVLNNTVGPLAERLFDQTAAVRRTVAQVSAKLLKEYRDRYSYFHKLLPLILTGLCDEYPETRAENERLWAEVGIQYANENEKDLKDKLDYLTGNPENYPTYLERPNLGCRELVQRNSSKMLFALSKELMGWQEDVRLRCGQLLVSLVLHCEDYFTQSLQDVLPAMYSACRDEDARVYENVMIAAKLIGTFIRPSSWLKLVLPALDSSTITYGHLRVLRSIMEGSQKDLLIPVLPDIFNILQEKDIRHTRKRPFQKELTECCRTVSYCEEISTQLFVILVSISALSDQQSDTNILAHQLLQNITQKEKHVFDILRDFSDDDNAAIWTAVTPERCVFDTLLSEFSVALLPHLPLVVNILTRALNVETDAEARLKTFIALNVLLGNEIQQKSENDINDDVDDDDVDIPAFVQQVVEEALMPSLVWKAGRTAEALRTAAIVCLCEALHHIDKIPETLINMLVTLAEDHSSKTRKFAVLAIGILISRKEKSARNEILVVVYPEILKRLDDPVDSVRLVAMETLYTILQGAKLIPVHHHYIVDTLLIHIEDQNEVFKNWALHVLKVTGDIDPDSYLANKLEKEKELFRNQEACDELLEYLKSLNIERV